MRFVLILLTLVVAAPVAAKPAPVEVRIIRSGDHFVAQFQFPRSASAWGFFRSSKRADQLGSWRPASWKVLTPGAQLQRRGNYDALVATGKSMPRRVEVEITPYTRDLVSDYIPALRIGRGYALFDGHFAAFSVASPTQLDRLPIDLDGQPITDSGTRVRFVAGRTPLRIAGDVEGYRKGDSSGAYGLFDVPVADVRSGIASVIDPDLPNWLADDLRAYTPRVIGKLTAMMGPAGLAEPTILASWEGDRQDGYSMNGGTLRGLVMMRFSGQMAAPVTRLQDMAHWFIAHEAAHFWLGQSVSYAGPRDSWIMEGGADLLAVRTVAGLDPAYDGLKTLNAGIADCVKLAGKPVATAPERGEHRATYACGAVFSLVAERAAGGNFAAFVGALIHANRSDGKASSGEWLALLDRTSGNPDLARRVAALLDRGSTQPAADIAALMAAAGIPHRLDAAGVPVL